MNLGNAYQVGLVLGVEGVKIGLMLEVVGIHFPVFHHGVGNHIVGILGDLQGPAVLGKNVAGDFQDLRVGDGRSGHGDDLVFLLGTGAQAQDQSQAKNNCKYFFHS